MPKNKLTVYSGRSLSEAVGALREVFKKYKYFTVTIKIGKKRSINLNYVLHGWFQQVSDELQEHDAGHIKRQVKYHLVLPILRADDEEFNDKCKNIIDVLPYEHRIEAMEYLPATSICTNNQLLKAMKMMQLHYADRVLLDF